MACASHRRQLSGAMALCMGLTRRAPHTKSSQTVRLTSSAGKVPLLTDMMLEVQLMRPESSQTKLFAVHVTHINDTRSIPTITVKANQNIITKCPRELPCPKLLLPNLTAIHAIPVPSLNGRTACCTCHAVQIASHHISYHQVVDRHDKNGSSLLQLHLDSISCSSVFCGQLHPRQRHVSSLAPLGAPL